MNAKKIMGAVLVALLAAALFVGAGAAATDMGTVFVNQKVNGLTGTWTSGTNSITAVAVPGEDGYGYFTGEIVEGVYINADETKTITVKYPAVSVSAVAGNDVYAYQFANGVYYTGSLPINVDIVSPATVANGFELYLTYPDGSESWIGDETDDGLVAVLTAQNVALGEYSIRAVFNATDFVKGTLYNELITKPVTFKVAEAGDVTIAASADQILKSETFKVTITGQPGITYNVEWDNLAFEGAAKQLGLPGVEGELGGTGFNFIMPNTGSVEFVLTAGDNAEDSEKITAKKYTEETTKKVSVTIKFAKGTISAESDAASYFVGDVITISGTNTAGEIVGYSIKGTNFEYDTQTIRFEDGTATSKNFEFEIATEDILNEKTGLTGKKLDVGTYTLTIFVGNMGLNDQEPTAKATVALVLKQPFITIAEAPEVIVQNTDVEFVINAEATEEIAYYIFGTNYFAFDESVDADEEVANKFVVELKKADTKNMSTGQYFMVIQHPMYDGFFNIMAENGAFYLNTTATADEDNGQLLFKFDIRQTANAAQALCDNLDSQTIDDMYVKYSFFVVGEDESFTISDIPTTIAQGETFTISGTSTANAGDFVTVEMISTAFAAVPKETVGSAAFIAVTTQIADDGTWEVTFDTSDLNVDEYSLKVACGDATWKNVNIDVVEAADEPVTPPTDEPGQDEPGQDEPVAPETPGFGALAALAGLGAVAVLLLRRE